MTVRRIDGDDVCARFHERRDAIHGVRRRTDRRACQKSAVGVPCGVGVLNGFFNILDRDQSFQIAVLIYDGKFFDSVFAENFLRLFQGRTLGGGDESLLRHHVGDGLVVIAFKAKVAVGENADELALFGNGHAADTVFFHKFQSVLHEVVGFQEERVGNDAVFAAFYSVYVRSLFFDGHILVNDTEPPFPRHGNRHTAFGNRIHRRADQGQVELNLIAEFGPQIHVARQHVGCLRDQKYVVKRQAFFYNSATHLCTSPCLIFVII